MQIWFLSNGSYSLKKCHNPFGKAIQPPPPYGKIPVEHGFSLRGASLTTAMGSNVRLSPAPHEFHTRNRLSQQHCLTRDLPFTPPRQQLYNAIPHFNPRGAWKWISDKANTGIHHATHAIIPHAQEKHVLKHLQSTISNSKYHSRQIPSLYPSTTANSAAPYIKVLE